MDSQAKEGSKIERAGCILCGCLIRHGNEGDLDNYAKTLKDALNGIAWEDDRQVVESHCYKVYVPSVDDQRVVIEIEKA
jgi:Holliday junction resolvase